jgi:hypothetical protein
MMRGEHGGLFGGTIKTIEKKDRKVKVTLTSGRYLDNLDEPKKETLELGDTGRQFAIAQFADDFRVGDPIEVFLLREAIKPVTSALVMELRPSSIDPELKGKRGASDNNDHIDDWDANGNRRLDDMEGYRLQALLAANIEKGQGIIHQLDQLKNFKVYEVKYVPAQAGSFTKSNYLTGLGRVTIWQPERNLSKYYIDIKIEEAKGGYIGYDNLRRLFDVDKKSDEIIKSVRANLRSRKPVETQQQRQTQTEQDPEKEIPDYLVYATLYDGRGTQAFGKVEVSKILNIKQGRDKNVRLVVMGGPGIANLDSPIKVTSMDLLLEEELEIRGPN